MSTTIDYEHFDSVEMRAGTILNVEPNKKARKPAYVLQIDFGDYGIKKSSAQITEHYNPDELIGTQIVAVMNFPSKHIAGVKSEVLVLGCLAEGNSVVLLHPSMSVPNGARVA